MIKKIKNKGFTLMEVLIVIGVIALLGAIIFPSLSRFRNEQSLQNTSVNIVNYLNLARSNSLSSLDGINYGIHFDSDDMVYFVGDTYDGNALTNQIIPFSTGVILDMTNGLNLNNGSSNVIFPRLRGEVSGYGTITIELSSDPSNKKSIKVDKLGSISFE